MTVASSITGSANMNNGIFPDVSVTIVDNSRIRDIPDDSMISPLLSLPFFLAIMNAESKMTAPIRGYNVRMERGIVPLAFPSRSKWAGRSSGNEPHFTVIANAFAATISTGIIQYCLFILFLLFFNIVL